MVKRNNYIVAFVCITLTIICLNATMVRADPDGTRQGEIGWQYETFDENLEMTITPETPTTDNDIVIEIVSKIPGVDIQTAYLEGVVDPYDGLEFPYVTNFQRWNDSALRCRITPFPYNGYRLTFWIFAYDWFNYKLDSRESYNNLYFDIVGSGWKHESFADNVRLTYAPMTVNASEEVKVTIESKENVTFGGANLWWTYETPDGESVSGVGRNFSKKNANMTEMSESILGYTAGTNVTFWVQVWDQYNDVLISAEYNYTVLGFMEYTDFPFEYVTVDSEGNFDHSEWTPTYQILIPMVILCALALPLFLYLKIITEQREFRKRKLILSGGMADESDPTNVNGGDEPDEP